MAELEYPTRTCLRNWWKGCEATGEVPVGKDHHRKSKYTDDRARAAVNHYLVHGKSLSKTTCALGHPKDSDALRGWIDELTPGQHKRRGSKCRFLS